MVNKRGYMKTLEAVFSVILLLIVIVSIVSINKYEFKDVPSEIIFLQSEILDELQSNQTLRGFVYDSNISDLEDFVDLKINSNQIGRSLQICQEVLCQVLEGLDADNIYVDSLIIHEPEENNNYLFRLYLWYNA